MENDKAKIFVGGISRETSEEALREHFSKYGVVEGCLVAKDKLTRVPRGFGFVWFSDSSCAAKALQDSHVILGRTVDVKKAIPKGEQYLCLQQPQQLEANGALCTSKFSSNSNSDIRTKKIFVGGLAASLTEDQFKSYFEGFGRIVDVVVMHDRSTKRPRGFGFVTFDSEVSVDKATQHTFHELKGRLVEVKRAVPKDGIVTNNGSNYICRDGVKGPYSNCSQLGYYPPYAPRFDFPVSYAPLPGYIGGGTYVYGTGMYDVGYPTVISSPTFSYPSFVPGNPWGGPMMIRGGSYTVFGFNNGYVNNGGNFGDINTNGYSASQGPAGNVKLSETVDSTDMTRSNGNACS